MKLLGEYLARNRDQKALISKSSIILANISSVKGTVENTKLCEIQIIAFVLFRDKGGSQSTPI